MGSKHKHWARHLTVAPRQVLWPLRAFRDFFREKGTLIGSAKCNEKWYFFGAASRSVHNPSYFSKRNEIYAEFKQITF